jgi:hypothetical protein
VVALEARDRAMRYWELVDILHGRPDEEFTARVAHPARLLAALRHHRDHRNHPPDRDPVP